jgi:hypothetical protein
VNLCAPWPFAAHRQASKPSPVFPNTVRLASPGAARGIWGAFLPEGGHFGASTETFQPPDVLALSRDGRRERQPESLPVKPTARAVEGNKRRP